MLPGASAVQTIPEVAKVAKELFVFQRTPCYCMPRNDGPSDPEYMKRWSDPEDELFEQRRDKDFSDGERGYPKFAIDKAANERMSDRNRARIQEQVDDPVTAELLTPKYPLYCKRPPVHDGEA